MGVNAQKMKNNYLTKTEINADNCGECEAVFDGRPEAEFKVLPLNRVFINPALPQKVFDNSTLNELANSIRDNGVLRPILVRQTDLGYQIVSGEKRYRACLLIGAKTIPAIVSRQPKTLASLIESIRQSRLNPIDEARAIRGVLCGYGFTHCELAAKIGCSRSSLTNKIRLLRLSKRIQGLVASKKLSVGHAKVLSGIKEPSEALFWAKKVIKEHISVSKLEKQVAKTRRCSENKISSDSHESEAMPNDLHTKAAEQSLQELLGAKVKIRRGKNKGHIEIEFYSQEDLERVVDSMVSKYM